MGKEWNDIIRQKMEGHQKNPPEGLWEGISEQMGFTQAPVRKKPMIRRLYYGAAAAILALAGFFVFHDPHTVEEPQVAEAVQPVSDNSSLTKKEVKEPVETPTQPTPYYNSKASAPYHQMMNAPLLAKATVSPTVVEEEVSESIPETVAVQEEVAEADHIQKVEAEQEPKETEKRRADEQPLRAYNQSVYQSYTPVTASSSSSDRWAVSLKASGGLLASNTSEQTKPVFYDNSVASDEYNGYDDVIPMTGKKIKPYRMTERVADHHLPVQVGLSLHYQLSEKTALLTGLNYTFLYSKFNVPLYKNAEYEQKLRYLGIPFGVAQQLWKKNRFYLYASAGVMLEKCLNDEPWQWSVNGALGVEYRMSRQVGFYLEPSLGYYFDDGTSLEHYFKEHPLTPSLEFGLRMHLNK
ncbi:MAG: hypothetical protein IKH64_07725 [Prevotella sp.]|nr:hypothetical protein [Prevotella sp.]